METRARRAPHPLQGLTRLSLVAAIALGATFLASGARADKKQYSYEENPVRLGLSALHDGKFSEAQAHFQEAVENEVDLPHAHFGLAEIAVRQGNDALADSLYQLAISEQKGGAFPEAHAERGVLLLRAGKDDAAAAEIGQALKEDKNRWEAQYAKALFAIHQKKFDEAKEALKEGRSKRGLGDGEDRYHYGLARLAFEQDDLAGAEREALAALTVDPTNADYVAFLADIYSKRGEPGLAIQKYEQAAAAPGATPTAAFYHHLGSLYEKINEPNEALRRYTEAVKIDSTYAPAFQEMGRLYTAGKVWDKAFLAYGRYLRFAPKDLDATLSFMRAALAPDVRQYKAAHEAGNRAFAMDSTRADVRLLFARASAQDKDPARASQLYASLPDTSLLEPIDHVRLGQIDFEAQQWGDAEAHLKTAVAKDSTSVEAYFILGLTEMRLNRPDDAVTALTRASQLAPPTFSAASLNLGIALLQAKRPVEGIAALRQARTQAPDNPQVILTLAQALATADSTDAAIVEYRRAIEINDADARAYRGLGLCQIQKKSYGEAVNALKQATALDAGNADGWALLGQAYLGLNDVVHAGQAAERCLAINPGHTTGKSVLEVSKKARSGSAQ